MIDARGHPRIFINYRRRDSAADAGRLYDRLLTVFEHDQVFMDVSGIPLGADFRLAIEEQVVGCDVMLILIGPSWLLEDEDGRRVIDKEDDFVRLAIEVALKREILTVPVLLDGARLPREEDLPIQIRKLANIQAATLSHSNFARDSDRLIRSLTGILSQQQDQSAPRGKPEARISTSIVDRVRKKLLGDTEGEDAEPARDNRTLSKGDKEANARIRQLARLAARESDLGRLDAHVARLPEGTTDVLRDVPKLRAMVEEIAQLQNRLSGAQRPMFQEPIAAQLAMKIENFWHRVGGLKEPLASEYRDAAEQWQEIADRQLEDIRARAAHTSTAQVFRAGDPVDRSNEAFVPRMSAIELLERQIMLARGCPGLLIYGRRRMGKSTLLLNLSGFLPTSVRIAIVSMQNPHAFSSQESLAGLLVTTAWNSVGREVSIAPRTLPEMFTALDAINLHLKETGQRLLLACDEFEMIDAKIGEGVFSKDLLHTLRESIQTHRHIVWTFVGSHSLGELRHADWASYFVSLRTVEVTQFTPDETRLLLSEPLRFSPHWRERPTEAPRFTTFWGKDGIKQIHTETGGWPHLVQLVAETCVDLANDKSADNIDAELLLYAFDESVRRGDTVLRQLIEGESIGSDEDAYLRDFRNRETQVEPNDSQVRRRLRYRHLVVVDGIKWRLRAPLMRRWIVANG